MGNTPSSEVSRNGPQRLSKPRPANQLSTPDSPSPSDLSASSIPRYSRNYLAGSRHALDDCTFPIPDARADHATISAVSVADQRFSRAESPVQGSDFAAPPRPTELQTRGRRGSTGILSSATEEWLSNANSMVFHTRGGPRSRAYSMHENGHREQRERTQSVHRPSASRRPSSVGPYCLQSTQSTAVDAKSEMSQSANDPSCSPRSSEYTGSPIAQTHSDASLYIPMRRRSLIQTPGIATRGVKDEPPLPVVPSIQINPAIVAPKPSYDPPVRQIDNHLLQSYTLVNEHERVVTPCEEQYRQLGGIKFGTLRITNGSPARSPAVELSNPVAHHAERESGSEAEPVPHDELAWPLKRTGTSSDTPCPSDTVKTEKPIYEYSTPRLSKIADNFTCGKSIQLSTEISWLLGSNEDYATPIPRTTASDVQTNPSGTGDVPRQGKVDVEYSSPEVLDVREDSNAKARDNRVEPNSSVKHSRGLVARSDSGFVSTSTSSSTSSRKALSQADSGYSSNFSLRSIRDGSKKKRRDEGNASPETSRGTQAGRVSQHTSSSRTPFAFMSRLSTRVGKNHEHQSPNPGVLSKHLRTRSVDVEASQFEASSQTPNDLAANRPGRLHRFLSGSARRRSFPTVYMSHDIHDEIPAVPSDIEEKLQEHNGLFPTASKRIALRVESSQETLKTILSVESQSPASKRTQDVNPFQEARRERASQIPESQHQNQSDPIVQHNSNPESTPSWNLGPQISIKRNPISSGMRTQVRSTKDHRSISSESQIGSHGDIRPRNEANAANLHASTGAKGIKSHPSRIRRTLTKPNPRTAASSSKTHILKSRASAPVLTNSVTVSQPTIPSRLYRSNTPPLPTSLRNQSADISGQQGPSQVSATASGTALSLLQKGSRESLRSNQLDISQHRTQGSTLAGKQPEKRYSYGGSSRQSAIAFGQIPSHSQSTSSRPNSDGQDQQYRILHSYNSPAYRNAPIWG